MKGVVRSRLARWGVGFGVVVAAHFAPLSLTREQRARLLLAMAGRERSEVQWVEEVTDRSGVRTMPGDSQLWVTLVPTLDELGDATNVKGIDGSFVFRR